MQTAERNVVATSPNGRRLGRRLRDLLKNEARLQNLLLVVATDIREAIIERDTAALTEREAEHRAILAEAEVAAAQRQELNHTIGRAFHIPAASVTLSRVLEVLPADVSIEIGVTATLLLDIARQVNSAHALNRDLLENELEHVGLSLEVLARAAAPRQDYTRRQSSVSVAAIMLDRAA